MNPAMRTNTAKEVLDVPSALLGPYPGPSKAASRHRRCKDSLFRNRLGGMAKWGNLGGTWTSGGPLSVLEQILTISGSSDLPSLLLLPASCLLSSQ
jgi:hypothetical protein